MLLLFSPVFIASAQVSTNFNNDVLIRDQGKFNRDYGSRVDFQAPEKNIPDLVRSERLIVDSSNVARPYQFATPVSVDLDISKSMKWNNEGAFVFGKYVITAKGAMNTSINFDRFYLPKGTEMYVYNENGSMITGPVTERENNAAKTWGSWVYNGPILIIEVKTPAATRNELELHASNIAYGYKQVYKTQLNDFGTSASCEVNVLCPQGAGWDNERNSVALVLNDNGSSWCSGCMVMNTCNDDRPFYLTANHCFNPPGLPQQNVAAWRFTFQAWSPTCTPSQNSSGVTYNGSTLRANSAGSDFCLVELNNTPPANSGINYAGWSRNTNGINSTTIIHHPHGDVMKITADNNAPVFGNFMAAQCWHLQVDNGTTEGGSSGAPYFDQNHRVIGQHFGIDDGLNAICNQVSKFGGRFDVSWTGGGTNATRLSNWLDPSGSGAATTNTTNISQLALSISGDDLFCTTSNPYTITNLPAGATVSWSTNPQYFATPNCANCTSTTLSYGNDGLVTLTATLTNVCGGQTKTITKTVRSGSTPPTGFYYSGGVYNTLVDEISGSNYLTPNNWILVHANSAVNGTPQWTPLGGFDYSWTIAGNELEVNVQADGYAAFQMNINGECGTISKTYIFEPNGGNFALSVAPNPATSEVTISVDDQNATQAANGKAVRGIRQMIISDKLGNVVLKRNFPDHTKRARVNVSTLTSGFYIIQVFDGKNWRAFKLLKN
ncbi:MAG TPA: T9SS type A sorting domain-containing protein [Chitinophagaceae bacterium]|nr:T9SS type A sorting domain-containing protein [Chitinophagaceae bacterium]